MKSLFVCVAGRKREEGALCVERLVVLHKSERKFCNLNKAKSFMFQYFSMRTQFDKSQTAIWKWVRHNISIVLYNNMEMIIMIVIANGNHNNNKNFNNNYICHNKF